MLTGKHCHGDALTDNPERVAGPLALLIGTQGGELVAVRQLRHYPDDNVDPALIQLDRPYRSCPLAVIAAG